MQGGVHRHELEQSIAFKREQVGDGDARTRGRRRSAAEQRQLERDNRQKEAAFSVYFNGANDDRGDRISRRHSGAKQRDAPTLVLHATAASMGGEGEHRRRGWRRQSQEVTGKITEQPMPSTLSTSFTSPAAAERKEEETTAGVLPSPADGVTSRDFLPLAPTSPAGSPASFVIGQRAHGSNTDSRRRRRTWTRAAIEVKTEDGETVQLQPRRIDWDVQGEHERVPPPAANGATASKEGAEERKDEGQDTGEDTSAEVSYAGRSLGEEEEEKTQLPSLPPSPTLSASRSSSTPSPILQSTSRHSTTPSSHRSPLVTGLAPVMESDVVDSFRFPPPSPPPLPPSRARASLLPPSDDPPRPPPPPPIPPRPQLPVLTFGSAPLEAVFPPAPAPVDGSMSSRRRVAFGRRATAPAESVGLEGVRDGADEPEQSAHRASTAWTIDVEHAAAAAGAWGPSGTAGKQVAVQHAQTARPGRRSRTLPTSAAHTPPSRTSTTSPALPTSASSDSTTSSRLTALRQGRPLPAPPERITATASHADSLCHTIDAEHSRSRVASAPATAVASEGEGAAATCGPAVSSPALRRVSSHSLEELERSFDSLEQLHTSLLSSTPSTAAERKQRQQSMTSRPSPPSQPLPTPPAIPSPLPPPPVDGDIDDVDALIADFLSSTNLPPRMPSPSFPPRHAPPSSAVGLPVLPAGRVLTFIFHSTYSPASHLCLARVQLFDDEGGVVPASAFASVTSSPASPLPPSLLFSKADRSQRGWCMPFPPSTFRANPASLCVTFQATTRLSLISVWNGQTKREGQTRECTQAVGSKESRSGVREVEVRLDGHFLFRGPLRSSSSHPEQLLFTRDEALIASLVRSQQRAAEADATEQRQLPTAVRSRAAGAIARSRMPSTSSPRMAGAGVSGRCLQLLILLARSAPPRFMLPGFRVFSAASAVPVLAHPPTCITTTTASRALQATQLPAVQCLSLPLSFASPLCRMEWDEVAQEVSGKEVGLQLLVDGHLLWAGPLGGGEGDGVGHGLDVRWSARGTRDEPAKQMRVRIWREGREMLRSRG